MIKEVVAISIMQFSGGYFQFKVNVIIPPNKKVELFVD
jgi:hypothetical protein